MKYKYVKEVMRRKSFPDFFSALGSKVDWKEWSEIYGMYKVVLDTLYKTDFKPDIVFDIGGGKRPTFGTFLILNVKSINNVICIDPQLDDKLCKNIKGMHLYSCYLNDFVSDEKINKQQRALAICNHAHVSKLQINKFLNNFDEWVYITCPCCVDNQLDSGSYIIDKNVDSPKNTYYISSSQGV